MDHVADDKRVTLQPRSFRDDVWRGRTLMAELVGQDLGVSRLTGSTIKNARAGGIWNARKLRLGSNIECSGSR